MLQAVCPPLASPALRASQTLRRHSVSQLVSKPSSLHLVQGSLIPSTDWGPLSHTPTAKRDAESYFTTVASPTRHARTTQTPAILSPPTGTLPDANSCFEVPDGAGSPITPTAQKPYNGGRAHSSTFSGHIWEYSGPPTAISPLLTPTPPRSRAVSVNAAINWRGESVMSSKTDPIGLRPRAATLTAVLESSRRRAAPIIEAKDNWALIREGVCTKIVSTKHDIPSHQPLFHNHENLPSIATNLPTKHLNINAPPAVEAYPRLPMRPRLTHKLGNISSAHEARMGRQVTVALPLQDKYTLGKLRKGTPGVLDRQSEEYFV